MHRLLSLSFLSMLLWFLGCTSVERRPTSLNLDQSTLAELYEKKLKLDLLQDQLKLVRRISPQSKSQADYFEVSNSQSQVQDLERQIETEKSALAASADANIRRLMLEGTLSTLDRPRLIKTRTTAPYATHLDTLPIRDLSAFLMVDNFPKSAFYMNLNAAKKYELTIDNRYFSEFLKMNPRPEGQDSPSPQPFLEASLSCDAPFSLKTDFLKKEHPGPSQVRFRLFDSQWTAQKVSLSPSAGVQECRLFLKNPQEPKAVYAIRLIPDRAAFANPSEIDNLVQACFFPDAKNFSPLEQFFLTQSYDSMTCPESVQNIRTLDDPYEGVNAKLTALLGQPLASDVFKNQNPFVPLDFSKAPQLDQVLISYLVFRSDFYGTLLVRALEHHAKKGTLIRVLISEVITQKKDRDLLYGLAAKYPNFQVKEFKWAAPPGASLDELISVLHKTIHVKIFLTLSRFDSTANQVVLGGRNVHDGFVFRNTPNYMAYGSLIQYGKGKEENFIHWHDFESQFTDINFVKSVAAHYSALWDYDAKSFFIRSININLPVPTLLDPAYFQSKKPMVRHFVSAPYKDDQALERLYADLFDSAEKTIDISTPYFRPTEILGSAFERAIKRGVKIRLITRINLDGDTADFILSDVNKAGINRFLNNIEIDEYIEKDVILHSKVILVDGKLSVIGSVNLNQRSFIHDLENAVLIYSPDFHQEMSHILDSYRKTSKPVSEKQKIRTVNKIILGVPLIRRAL